jgi:hypothetical protein
MSFACSHSLVLVVELAAFYRVLVDPSAQMDWYPAAPADASGNTIDPRVFTSCVRYDGPQLSMPTRVAGRAAPITFGPFDVPILRPDIAARIATVAPDDVQLVAVSTEHGQRTILNVMAQPDAIDPERTVGERWPESAGRQDKIGRYRTILHLFIDPARVGPSFVFRPDGWRSALIISESVRKELTEEQLTGTRLVLVS